MADYSLRLGTMPALPKVSRNMQTALLVIGAALAAGLGTGLFGFMFAPVGLMVLGAVVLMIIGYEAFWYTTVFVLVGYFFLSKGFAYIGFFPIYVGESAIGIGMFSLLLIPFSSKIRIINWRRFWRIEMVSLLLFIGWEISRTIPYIRLYEFAAIRDAMLYGYVLYTFLIMLLVPREKVIQFFHLFGRMAPYLLVWIPILVIITKAGVLNFISFPGSNYPLFFTKGSDIGVILAGIGGYMLLQIDQHDRPWSRFKVWFCWIMFAFDLVFVSALGRANMVTTGAGLAIIFAIRPLQSRWYRPTLLGVLVISLLLATNTLMTVKIDLGIHREVSVMQLIENVSSIVSKSDDSHGGLEGTKVWRLLWWDKIISYTVHGPYFWTGKGYGINIAIDDGFKQGEELRSPHNGHMTILARSGVPGLALWALMLATMGLRLLYIAIARKKSNPWDSKYALWLLAYLTSFMVMTSFDVYLEGPMGAIPFFSILGMTLVYFTPGEDKEISEPVQDAENAPAAAVSG